MSVAPPPSGFTISVVTPCVSMFSAVATASGDAWLWMLMNPGATNRSVASISAVAVEPARSPTRAMKPFTMATSARYRGRPVPSMTIPPRTITSYSGGGGCAASTSASVVSARILIRVPQSTLSRDRFHDNVLADEHFGEIVWRLEPAAIRRANTLKRGLADGRVNQDRDFAMRTGEHGGGLFRRGQQRARGADAVPDSAR